MEYAKDEIFSISYKVKKDKLNYSLLTKVMKNIKGNLSLTLLITMGLLFSVLNCILIYSFFIMLNTL